MMIEEFAIALALLVGAALALVFRGRGGTVGLIVDRVVHTVRSMCRVAVLDSVRSNPLVRLICLLLLLIGTGWAATIAQVGVAETRRAIHFQRPSAHEARECLQQQVTDVYNLELDAQTAEIPLVPGPLDPRLRYHCPYGGTYSIDDSGRLHCSKHGSAPNSYRLPLELIGGKRP